MFLAAACVCRSYRSLSGGPPTAKARVRCQRSDFDVSANFYGFCGYFHVEKFFFRFHRFVLRHQTYMKLGEARLAVRERLANVCKERKMRRVRNLLDGENIRR